MIVVIKCTGYTCRDILKDFCCVKKLNREIIIGRSSRFGAFIFTRELSLKVRFTSKYQVRFTCPNTESKSDVILKE